MTYVVMTEEEGVMMVVEEMLVVELEKEVIKEEELGAELWATVVEEVRPTDFSSVVTKDEVVEVATVLSVVEVKMDEDELKKSVLSCVATEVS